MLPCSRLLNSVIIFLHFFGAVYFNTQNIPLVMALVSRQVLPDKEQFSVENLFGGLSYFRIGGSSM